MPSFEEIIRLSLKDSAQTPPPSALADRIILAIENKKRFQTVVKLAVYSAVTVASFIATALVWRAQWANIVNSEAVKLLSLLFSDTSVIATYWQEYLISVSESLPVVSIIFVAACVWAACASLWMTARTYTTFSHHATGHAKS